MNPKMLENTKKMADLQAQFADLRTNVSLFHESLDAGETVESGVSEKIKNLAREIKTFLPETEQASVEEISQKESLEKSDLENLDEKMGKISPEKFSQNPEKVQKLVARFAADFDGLQAEVVSSLGEGKIREIVSKNLDGVPGFLRGPIEKYIFQKYVNGEKVSRWRKFLIEDVGMGILGFFGFSFGLEKIAALKKPKLPGGVSPENPENSAPGVGEQIAEHAEEFAEEIKNLRQKTQDQLLAAFRKYTGKDVFDLEKFRQVYDQWREKHGKKLEGKSKEVRENTKNLEGNVLDDVFSSSLLGGEAFLDFLMMAQQADLTDLGEITMNVVGVGASAVVEIGFGAMTLMGKSMGVLVGAVPVSELMDFIEVNFDSLDHDSKILFWGLLYRKMKLPALILEQIGHLSGHAMNAILFGKNPVNSPQLLKNFQNAGLEKNLGVLKKIEGLKNVDGLAGEIGDLTKKIKLGLLSVGAMDGATKIDDAVKVFEEAGELERLKTKLSKSSVEDLKKMDFADFRAKL